MTIHQMSDTRTLRVLIVEDREDDALLVLNELERAGYAVTHRRVDTKDALRNALTEDWDIVLSDFSLPSMSAPDVLATLKAARPELPCIVVSGTLAEEMAVDLLRAGARDFVVKERLTRLVPAIERELHESVERRRLLAAESTLHEMRERMQFALEAVAVGTWETEVRTGKTMWSDVMERLHGLAPGTFEGTFDAFVERIHLDDRQRVLAGIERSQRDGTDYRLEYRTAWPDGSLHWILGIGRTLYDNRSVPVRAAGVSMDVTAQRHLEEQFRQAQKIESVGNLAGGIAHDFNNLLTVISGCCELAMLRGSNDTELIEYLEAIRGAASSASTMTRQLLIFSRRQVVLPQLVNLNETLNAFRPILRRLVEENIVIDFVLAPSLPPLLADPGQVEQVLLNLVANARDAMPEGGTVTIETSVTTRPDEVNRIPSDVRADSYIVLSVRDTGCGMSPEVQAHLFEPFFTTKPVGRGTGLGLATVYGIVKQSEGQIFVQSEMGAGTTFRIYLPVATTAPDAAESVEVQTSLATGGGETILVVEDNSAVRRLAERILQPRGYQVLTAADALQARRICDEYNGPIHLSLIDVIMPGESGTSVGEWICERRPETKLVYSSGYTGEALSHHQVFQPGRTFLQKPFTASQLLRAVRDVLSSPRETLT